MAEANRQLIHELKCTFRRWEEESDLHDIEILECVNSAVKEYYKEEIIDFESDIDWEEDDE